MIEFSVHDDSIATEKVTTLFSEKVFLVEGDEARIVWHRYKAEICGSLEIGGTFCVQQLYETIDYILFGEGSQVLV